MPAINLLQLRKQLNKLLWQFTDSEAFKKCLEEILDQYSLSSYLPVRENLSSIEAPDLNIPLIVMRELDLALGPTIREHPHAAFELSEALWRDDNLEMHTIAARIIGQIPIQYAEMALQQADSWGMHGLDNATAYTIIKNVSQTIMRENPEILMEKAREWCDSENKNKRRLGLTALRVLSENPNYLNLPAIFSGLDLLLPKADLDSFNGLCQITRILLNRSSIETAYYLRRKLENNPLVIEERLARSIAEDLPENSRALIQQLLRDLARKKRGKSNP